MPTQVQKRRRRYPTTYNLDAIDMRRKRHLDGLTALARYPFLTTPWLAPFFGVSTWRMKDLVTLLKEGGYISVPPNLIGEGSWSRKEAYELGINGEELLQDLHIPIHKHEFTGAFQHRLMSCKTRASFEIGTADHFKLHSWNELVKLGKIPAKTLNSDSHSFDVGDARLRPDSYPFVIDHGSTRYFVVGLEVDCATETIKTSYKRRHAITIKAKYDHYSAFIKKRLYKTLLGFPDCIILITTTSTKRLENMMQELRAYPELINHVGFQVFKDEPTGWAITEPWLLADGTTLNLNQP